MGCAASIAKTSTQDTRIVPNDDDGFTLDDTPSFNQLSCEKFQPPTYKQQLLTMQKQDQDQNKASGAMGIFNGYDSSAADTDYDSSRSCSIDSNMSEDQLSLLRSSDIKNDLTDFFGASTKMDVSERALERRPSAVERSRRSAAAAKFSNTNRQY